jgi:hypothetical protein
MRFTKFLAIATLLLAAPGAFAEFTTVTLASEVRLSEFRLPASVNGIATFKPCGACELKTVSVNADTRYRLNGQTVALPDMRRSLASVTNRNGKIVMVVHHLESDLITQISIRL